MNKTHLLILTTFFCLLPVYADAGDAIEALSGDWQLESEDGNAVDPEVLNGTKKVHNTVHRFSIHAEPPELKVELSTRGHAIRYNRKFYTNTVKSASRNGLDQAHGKG